MKMSPWDHTKGATVGIALVLSASASLITLNVAAAPDPACLSYLTIGDSNCNPAPVQPQVPVMPRPGVEALAPAEAPSAVDKYLADYGKPPREFVEFYLNPTAENASKWVQTYQGILQKGQDISKAWDDAERLYTSGGSASAGASIPRLVEPQPKPVVMPVQVPAQVAPAPLRGDAASRFGAFANTSSAVPEPANGIRQKGVSLTYFFSQTCPYCARMTPELAVLVEKIPNKLTFTCVDVTPVGATSRPDASYITSKLPCQWRLPNKGEVEMEQVSQTPTLIIQRDGEAPVRLSGYVPLAQLQGYF